MTKDEIIAMAREAGFQSPNPHDGYMGLAYDYRDGTDTGASLERFAALVAAAEREACAKVCDGLDAMSRDPMVARGSAEECAAAIRARGNA